MSRLRSSWSQVALTKPNREVVLDEFREELPALAEFMGGADALGDSPAIMPHGLNLFWEGGKMKFCLSRRNYPNCCFGCVPDPVKALQSVEGELQAGRFEWKARKA